MMGYFSNGTEGAIYEGRGKGAVVSLGQGERPVTDRTGREAVSERWRNHYDSWKTDAGTRYAEVLDEDGDPVDQDELDARAEDAAIERAEREREDRMFDRDSWED